jgi:hypothetical protein
MNDTPIASHKSSRAPVTCITMNTVVQPGTPQSHSTRRARSGSESRSARTFTTASPRVTVQPHAVVRYRLLGNRFADTSRIAVPPDPP